MTTSPIMSVTDELIAELEAACNEEPIVELGRTTIRRLLSERAELKRDAERYRWLREQCEMTEGGLTICKVGYCDLTGWSGDDPDAAIDAAMTP